MLLLCHTSHTDATRVKSRLSAQEGEAAGVAGEAEFTVERPFFLDTRLRAAARSSALILPDAVPPQAYTSLSLFLINLDIYWTLSA